MIPNSLFEQIPITDIMVLLESDRIKLNILKLLKEKEMTFGGLRTRTNTGFKTIKNNCEFLEKIGFVKMEKKVVGDRGREITFIKLTEMGKEYQEKIIVSN